MKRRLFMLLLLGALCPALSRAEAFEWWQRAPRLVSLIAMALSGLSGMMGVLYVLKQEQYERKVRQLRDASEHSRQEGREEERNRLAKEMHDGVGNQLLAIEMKMRNDGLTPQVLQLLSESREQVRRVSHGLMPPDFVHATLAEVLADYVAQCGGSDGCELTFRSDPPGADWSDVAAEKALGIYRIVQEALGNVLRHSGATAVAVVLQRQGEAISVVIADNGTSSPTVGHSKGIGQRTMRQRADALGGTISQSTLGGAHVFTLRV